jgi:hypothetical protein
MRRIPVSSSNIRSVGYDSETNVLEIEFNHGGIYHYTGVPEAVYRSFMAAGSKGTYHAQFIKNHYPYSHFG